MEEEKIQLKKQQKEKTRNFVLRLIGYILFGLVLPMGYLIWRFKLFSQTSKLNLGGWGIVLIIFTAVFFAKLIKQSIDTIESEVAKQCLNAIRKVFIPLLAVTLCLYSVGNAWEDLIKFFMILTICEPIAYVLNPFPTFLRQKEEEGAENKITKIIELFWDKKKD